MGWPFHQDFGCGDVLMQELTVTMWSKYVAGLKSYILSRDGVKDRLWKGLETNYKALNISNFEISLVYFFFVGDDFWENLSNFAFYVGPGIPHPNNLQGCEFLTSDELVFLLNVDVCSIGDDFLALRMVCATSCKCRNLPINCPPSCT